jgi:hypothetical protein
VGSEAKNLEAISEAIDRHNSSCPFPATEVRMNPYEVERLGWEEIRGLPIVGDPGIGTGRFRIVCGRDGTGEEIEETEAIGEPVEVGAPAEPARPGRGSEVG